MLLNPVFAALLLTASVAVLYRGSYVKRIFIPPPPGWTMVHGVLQRRERRRLVSSRPKGDSCCTECEKHL